MVMALARETNHAVDYDGPEREFRAQLAIADDIDAPGHNVEVFGGNIVMSPFSRWSYAKPMHSLVRQLEANAPDGYNALDAPFKFIFPASHAAIGPDVYVVDLDAAENDTPFAPCESLALVGELTSTSTRGNDLTVKLDIYGRSVPVYLLFDMKKRELTVYSEPSERGYRTHTTVQFGKPVQIPAPFDFELDTTAFTD
ncbi:Uma2 family endonuclease [Glycomyces albidus]|jgi:Uma2 family endonuclease|uniref:Uma2 family endonuclease n=1 Tax=Glycomyces albidus TaxID=2656774 RepID=A0A6L5G648_9ACTN|nr:Uma2 family endonuclease [Glycomyces albidus]MQM25106.1 Uma2 family endonuclease [Glycomyces albidus]